MTRPGLLPWFLGLVAAALILEVLGFAGALAQSPHSFLLRLAWGTEPFLVAGLWGAAVFLLAEIGFARALPMLAAGLPLDAVLFWMRAARGMPWTYSLLNAGAGVGFAALAALVVRSLRLRTPESRTAVITALTAPLFILISQSLLGISSLLHPRVFDGLMYRIDLLLVGPLSFLAGRWAWQSPAISWSLLIVYAALPFAFAVACVMERRQPCPPRDLVQEFLLLGALGFALYNLVPVVGPKFFFPDYPHGIPDAAAVPLTWLLPDVTAPRNCVPSLHLAWALSISSRLWSGRSAILRMAAAAFVGLTTLATLALGLHYAIDLVLGVLLMFTARAFLQPRGRGPTPWLQRLARWLPAAMLALWFVLLYANPEAFLLKSGVLVVVLAALSLILPALSERSAGARRQPVEDGS